MSNFFNNPFFVEEQADVKSFQEHDSQYRQINIEKEIQRQAKDTAANSLYTDFAPLGLAIDASKDIKVVIDIGCGTGWAANLLSEIRDIVYAIEPSLAAINVARQIHSNNHKIMWMNGFAQDELKKISLGEPALFNSLCVMSHLKDKTVIEICRSINQVALPGSVLSFSECYGCDYDDGSLWHVRREDWWQAQFPEWEFDFLGRDINWPAGGKKNFIAIRKNIG